MERSDYLANEHLNLNDKMVISKIRSEVHRKATTHKVSDEIEELLFKKVEEEFAKKVREKVMEALQSGNAPQLSLSILDLPLGTQSPSISSHRIKKEFIDSTFIVASRSIQASKVFV